jgi:hypothetical protein
MSAPAEVQTSFEGAEPLRLWSVTTLIDDGLGKGPGLINWLVRLIAETAVDKRKTVEVMLEESGRDATIKWLVDQRWAKSEKAKVRGTDVHKVAEAMALGYAPPEVSPEQRLVIKPYVEQLARWLDKWQPTYLLAEAPVYNVTRAYAGTCDGVMELQGRRLIFDYKTTEHPPDGEKSRPPWPEVALQLCAYSRAEMVGLISEQRYDGRSKRYYLFDPTSQHEPMPEVDGAICIVVSPYDCFAQPVRIDDEVFRAFLHVQACARWQVETSRDVFRGGVLDARAEAE